MLFVSENRSNAHRENPYNRSPVKALESMKIPILEQEISRIIKLYAVRGFHVKFILVDIQLKSIKDRGLLAVIVNVVGKGEHVPAIERFIRVIEERCRCYYAMLPFDVLPRMMVIHLLITVMAGSEYK
jgi:hypothetical protein